MNLVSGDVILISALGLPLVAAVLIKLADKSPNLRESITLIISVSVITAIVSLYFQNQQGMALSLKIAEPFDGMPVLLRVDSLGLLFALIASFLWLVTSIYSIGYMRGHHEKHQTRFYLFFALAIASVMAIAFSANLFTLFLFYELLTLLTYPLVTHAGTAEARSKGRVYLGILMGSSLLFFLLAILITWNISDDLTFRPGGILAGKIAPHWVLPLYLLFLFGIGKAAVMPLHKWLPAAMVAPTPVSALLHAVAVVKAGVFAILKVTLFIFGPDLLSTSGASQWLVWLPLFTILSASLIAMTKDNLKERLAYSTISQLSYIVLGAVMATSAGLLGASLHIVMHAFAKITLFFAAGAILVTSHKTKISELAGLGRKMPLTFTMFIIASLSIIGIPPLGGLWSKWFLTTGSLSLSGPEFTQWAIIGVLLISSLLNIAYLMIIPVKAFFSPTIDDSPTALKEAPLPCLIALVIPTLACVYLFFDPDIFYQLAQQATANKQE